MPLGDTIIGLAFITTISRKRLAPIWLGFVFPIALLHQLARLVLNVGMEKVPAKNTRVTKKLNFSCLC